MKRFEKIVRLLPYFFIFIASLYVPTDPDLGWHLKYGEYFIKHGQVLRDNTFSTLMPNFHWANVSWGTDVITYVTYSLGGFLGLTLLGALVITATFFVFSKAASLTLWDEALLFPILLYLEKPLNSVSFRGQLLSMFFLGVLVYLLNRFEKKPKLLYFIIPLFFVWVNLHGQFFLGLAVFAFWIVLHLSQKFFFVYKGSVRELLRAAKPLGIVFISSFLVTFINPFGPGVHLDAIGHLTSNYLKQVAEYLPFDMFTQVWWTHVGLSIFLLIGLLFLFFKGKLLSTLPHIGSAVLLYLLTFNVRRYAWPAYYLTLPILQPLSNLFKPDTKKATLFLSFLVLVSTLAIAVVDKYPFTQFATYSWENYCQSNFLTCSPKSAEFLKEHTFAGELFSLYSWGGWLIWNYPEIKPTIDGRMHIWVDEKKYSGFAYYYAYEQNLKDINNSPYAVVYMSPDKPLYTRMRQLVKKGLWKQVYRDSSAGIFVRVKR